MKKILLFVILAFSNLKCVDCDGQYYQVIKKTELDKIRCEYIVRAYTECYSWRKQVEHTFVDSCKLYLLSQKMTKGEAYKTR